LNHKDYTNYTQRVPTQKESEKPVGKYRSQFKAQLRGDLQEKKDKQ
jgi:hypothetical protein